jgi:hypothetical protein
MLYVRYVTLDNGSLFIGDTPILSTKKMLHKDYVLKRSVAKKSMVGGTQGAWRQDEMIVGKPPVVKQL